MHPLHAWTALALLSVGVFCLLQAPTAAAQQNAAEVPITIHTRLYGLQTLEFGSMDYRLRATVSLTSQQDGTRKGTGLSASFDNGGAPIRARGAFTSSGRFSSSSRGTTTDVVYDQSAQYPSLASMRSGAISISGPDNVEFARTFGARILIDVPINGVARTTMRGNGITEVRNTASFPLFGPLNVGQEEARPDRFKLELDVFPNPTAPDTPDDQPLFDAMRDMVTGLQHAGLPALSPMMGATTEVLPDGNVIVRASVNASLPGGWRRHVSFVQWVTARGVASDVPQRPWLHALLQSFCVAGRDVLGPLQTSAATLTAYDEITFDDPYYDGTRWTTRRFKSRGSILGTDIELLRSPSALENAAALYHESVHSQQSRATPWRDREYAAYVAEEGFRIRSNLPPHQPSFRNRDGTVNTSAIREYVAARYPRLQAAQEHFVGRKESGETIVQRADGSEYSRSPRAGDSYPASAVIRQPEGGEVVDLESLRCR